MPYGLANTEYSAATGQNIMFQTIPDCDSFCCSFKISSSKFICIVSSCKNRQQLEPFSSHVVTLPVDVHRSPEDWWWCKILALQLSPACFADQSLFDPFLPQSSCPSFFVPLLRGFREPGKRTHSYYQPQMHQEGHSDGLRMLTSSSACWFVLSRARLWDLHVCRASLCFLVSSCLSATHKRERERETDIKPNAL